MGLLGEEGVGRHMVPGSIDNPMNSTNPSKPMNPETLAVVRPMELC
jgi:hypothetical protein